MNTLEYVTRRNRDLWSPPFKSLDPYVREAWIAAVDVILGFEYTFEVTEEVRRNLIEAAKNLEIVRPNKGQTP